ncbi:protein EMSY-LIKE 1-like isoform X3 [Durio zibethinus]|uniref:Protein EMSY-LIKE 1-like isoform X3 n=1 Tax=Durio zibethinus TaxID=66656 RepID=A0A6P5YXN1_DURZI|nr:protein EMSY-LIKE 1-like isoform X3 [Durio zibethinus]
MKFAIVVTSISQHSTDDDLPPSHPTRVSIGGNFASNGRSIVGSASYSKMHFDMEAQIHLLEQEAYCSVLRAFKAQSDAITWEKEGLITELRKELRVSDDEHRELLTKVNADEIIRKISRDWRQAGGNQSARLSASHPVHSLLPSPTVSASRKKQKTSQLGQSLPGLSSAKAMQYPSAVSAGNRQFNNRGSVAGLPANEPAEGATFDPIIGRKVWTRWPEDNNFYEAVITDYNPSEGRHALVYDINTANETWEWVDLKEISPDDIRWDGEDPGISYRGGHGFHGAKKSFSRGGPAPGPGRGRGSMKGQSRKEFLPSQNGNAKKVSDDIELLNTDTLVKEVERVFDTSHPDPLELEKAKKKLKEHEQALIDAIARLADASDGESDGEKPVSHQQPMDQL